MSAPISCPVGRYRVDLGASSLADCLLCPAGRFSNTTGAFSTEDCLACDPFEDSAPGSSVCWPGIVNVTANDPEPVLPGISDGDTLTLWFTKATSAPPVGDANDLAALLSFSAPLFDGPVTQAPTRLTGRWVGGNTQLVLTLMDTRNVSVVDTRIGLLTVNVSGIRDSTGVSSPLVAVSVGVGGTWGQSSTPRFLANGRGFEASNTGGQVGLGAGDSIVLRFNQPVGSSFVPIATKGDIDAVFNFSTPLGLNYTGVWETVYLGVGGSDYQARITIVTPTSNATTAAYRNATRVGGPLSVIVLASAGLKALDQSGDFCNDTTTLTAGSWGDVVCDLGVSSRSWRSLRVSWTRPRTVVGFAPGYAVEVSNTSTFGTVLRRVELPSTVVSSAVGPIGVYGPVWYDVGNLSLGVDYYVRTYVSQPSGAAWGPPKAFATTRAGCDCTPTTAACAAETPGALSPSRTLRPVVTSVTTPSAAFTTRGDDSFDLFGTGLGIVAGDVAVTYSNAASQARAHSYNATACAVVDANRQVRCKSVAGVGRDFQFLVTVDGLASSVWTPEDQTVSYAAPVIESFTGPALTNALTSGGQQVSITGSGFGPAEEVDSVDFVQYFAVGVDNSTFRAEGCTIAVSHRNIVCNTSIGVGGRVTWSVSIANQTSTTPSTSFHAPTIVTVTPGWTADPAALSQLDTRGGQPLDIGGTNFGPAAPLQFITSASLGPFALVGCNVTAAHVALRCLTPVGVGLGHRVSVVVADLVSDLSPVVVSYAPPLITRLSPSVVPTAGGTVVTISGSNFGATTATMVVTVNGVPPTRGYQVSLTGHTSAEFTADDLTALVSVEVVVVVAGQPSNTFVLQVAAPAIATVSLYDMVTALEVVPGFANDSCLVAVGGNANADVVELVGANFGSNPGLVTMEFVVGATRRACDVCSLTHTEARCPVPLFVGHTQTATIVFSLAGRNSTILYSYSAVMRQPNIRGIEPLVFPTTGGTRLLTVSGTDMKDRGSVTLHSAAMNATLACRVPPSGESEGPGGVVWAKDGTRIVCEVPDGVGTDWVVTVYGRQTVGNFTGGAVGFQAPRVDAPGAPIVLPTDGGTVVINGANFGSPNLTFCRVVVSVQALPAPRPPTPCPILSWNHTAITCLAPEGVLQGAVVTVSVGSQSAGAPLLTYDAPAFGVYNGIATLSAAPWGTEGGGPISFSGVNFGPPGLLRLILRDPSGVLPEVECADMVTNGHRHGLCKVPPGAGAHLAMVLSNGGSNSTVGPDRPTFSYTPPNVTSVEVLPFTAPSNATGALLGLHAPVSGSFLVRATGSSFSLRPAVTIGGEACSIVNASHVVLVCRAPAGYGANVSLVVGAGSQVSPRVPFAYSPPYILSVEPAAIGVPLLADAVTGLRIRGLNFGPAAAAGAPLGVQVRLDGALCPSSAYDSPTEVRCVASGGLNMGQVDVTVTVVHPLQSQTSNTANATFVCSVGHFGSPGSPCRDCPAHARCDGGVAQPAALVGAYDNGKGEFLLCSPPKACKGQTVGEQGDLQCAEGYFGVKCANCVSRFYRFGEVCKPCPSLAWLYITTFVLLLVLVVYAAYWLNKKRINLSALAIGVDFMQVVAMFASFNFAWPVSLKGILNTVSASNLNMQLLAPECSLKFSFTQLWLAVAAVPILVLGALGLVCAALYGIWRLRAWLRAKKRLRLPPRPDLAPLEGLAFTIMYFM